MTLSQGAGACPLPQAATWHIYFQRSPCGWSQLNGSMAVTATSGCTGSQVSGVGRGCRADPDGTQQLSQEPGAGKVWGSIPWEHELWHHRRSSALPFCALVPFTLSGGHWCPSVVSRTLPIQWQSNELL